MQNHLTSHSNSTINFYDSIFFLALSSLKTIITGQAKMAQGLGQLTRNSRVLSLKKHMIIKDVNSKFYIGKQQRDSTNGVNGMEWCYREIMHKNLHGNKKKPKNRKINICQNQEFKTFNRTSCTVQQREATRLY